VRSFFSVSSVVNSFFVKIAEFDSNCYNSHMIREANLLKLSNIKMKSSRLRKIIKENENIIGEKKFIDVLVEKKEIKKEEVEKANIDSRLEKQICVLKQENVKMLTIFDEEYPKNLIDLEDSPPILYCRGKVLPKDSNAVSIVGTRRATEYGRTAARTLGKKLSELGITIVSGLAIGIDTRGRRKDLGCNGNGNRSDLSFFK
jgi:DNA processing protein